jgi:hypothetical protein
VKIEDDMKWTPSGRCSLQECIVFELLASEDEMRRSGDKCSPGALTLSMVLDDSTSSMMKMDSEWSSVIVRRVPRPRAARQRR